MEAKGQDPFQDLITDGRVGIKPDPHYGIPTPVEVDLDHVAEAITTRLLDVFKFYGPIRNLYVGTEGHTNTAITNDITAVVDFAIAITYNRLRAVAEYYSPALRLSHMNTRAPISSKLEFPAFLSSTLGSIGPLRLQNGPVDTLIVYVTSPARMNFYGRSVAHVFAEGRYARMTAAFKAVNIRLAPIDIGNTSQGSYFTTLIHETEPGLWNTFGTVHPSHYENEDLIRSWLCQPNNIARVPFENIGIRIGYVDNEAVITALSAVQPQNVPQAITAQSTDTYHVGGHFEVNLHGIRPAVAEAAGVTARAAGVYILGRGHEDYFKFRFANQVGETEVHQILRHRLTAK